MLPSWNRNERPPQQPYEDEDDDSEVTASGASSTSYFLEGLDSITCNSLAEFLLGVCWEDISPSSQQDAAVQPDTITSSPIVPCGTSIHETNAIQPEDDPVEPFPLPRL